MMGEREGRNDERQIIRKRDEELRDKRGKQQGRQRIKKMRIRKEGKTKLKKVQIDNQEDRDEERRGKRRKEGGKIDH